MKKNLMLVVAVLALLCGAPQFAHATSDGTPSTGSFTIVNVSSLAAATASGSITVISTTGSLNARVVVGPALLIEGRDWRIGASTSTAAVSLKNAINAANASVVATYSAGQTLISLAAIDSGALYNGVSLVSSSPTALSVSGPHLTGGQDNAVIRINAIALVQGRDWFIQDVASNTATNLAAGVNHSERLENQVEAVALGAQVYLRASLSPVAYTLSSSDPADLSVSGANMTGGSAGNLARSVCNLGAVNALPTANYPKGCTLYLNSDPTKLYLSTETVVGSQSWLAK